MKACVLLIINPVAGSMNEDLVNTKTREWSQRLDKDLKTYRTTGEGDEDQIRELLNTENFDRAIIAGGDGTIKMASSVLVDTEITLGILAFGSANGLAISLNIPEDLNDQLYLAFHKSAKAIDTILVNGTLCVHMADIGLNAELIYNYERTSSSGKLGYAIQAIPTLLRSGGPYKFDISSNDQNFKGKGVLLAFANAQKYGTGVVVNPSGEIDDGHFEVVILKRLRLKDVLKIFINNWTVHESSLKTLQTKSVTVQCEKLVPLQVDGEFIGKFKSFKAEVKPQSLNVAIP